MNSKPRRVFFAAARTVLAISAVNSLVNIVLTLLGSSRMMPAAFTMTGYLTRAGMAKTAEQNSAFFTVLCASLAGIVCLAYLLGVLLCGRNAGWLVSSAVIFLADCAGIAILIAAWGYQSGYWFELAGHGLILLTLLTAFSSLPRRGRDGA